MAVQRMEVRWVRREVAVSSAGVVLEVEGKGN